VFWREIEEVKREKEKEMERIGKIKLEKSR
jgi:hypothetical protein